MYSKDKQINDLVIRIEKEKMASLKRGSKHWILRRADGKFLTIPGSPSDHRAYYNFKSQVRRFLGSLPGSVEHTAKTGPQENQPQITQKAEVIQPIGLQTTQIQLQEHPMTEPKPNTFSFDDYELLMLEEQELLEKLEAIKLQKRQAGNLIKIRIDSIDEQIQKLQDERIKLQNEYTSFVSESVNTVIKRNKLDDCFDDMVKNGLYKENGFLNVAGTLAKFGFCSGGNSRTRFVAFLNKNHPGLVQKYERN